MNRSFFKTLLMALCLLLAITPAMAQEMPLGHLPQVGLILPLTQEDVDAGFRAMTSVASVEGMPDMPVAVINYTDQQLLAGYMEQYASPDMDEVNTAMLRKELEGYCTYPAGQILLLDAAYYESITGEGASLAEMLGVNNLFVLGENEGYVYVAIDYEGLVTSEDADMMASIAKVMERARELMNGATFQPIVVNTESGAAFPAFTTTDIYGNPVTSDVFAGKTLTVVNVWGTFCGPCIDEMDELAAWSSEMPGDVQLIGLVSDLYSLGDTETLETAIAICEATGASVYTNLVVSTDFVDFLSEITGVPTTYFVDGNGNIVGDPVIGANVPACRQFVEDYLNAQ